MGHKRHEPYQHVYQHNIIPHHVQWQLAWWLDVSGEGKNHVKKKTRKKEAKTENMARKKKNTKIKRNKKEKKKKMIKGKEGRIQIRKEKN